MWYEQERPRRPAGTRLRRGATAIAARCMLWKVVFVEVARPSPGSSGHRNRRHGKRWSQCWGSSCDQSSSDLRACRFPVWLLHGWPRPPAHLLTKQDVTASVCSMKLAVKAMHTSGASFDRDGATTVQRHRLLSAALYWIQSTRKHVDWCFTLVLLSFGVQAGTHSARKAD